MRNKELVLFLLLFLVSGSVIAKEKKEKAYPGEMGGHGDWIASGGMGLTISPTFFFSVRSWSTSPDRTFSSALSFRWDWEILEFSSARKLPGATFWHIIPAVKPSWKADWGLPLASGDMRFGSGCEYTFWDGL